MLRRLLLTATALALIVAAPLAGLWLAGVPVAAHLALPPRAPRVPHPGFSWPVFGALALALVLFLAALAAWILGHARRAQRPAPRGRFPLWGWLGAALLAVAWVLAWGRFEWLGPWQRHTFTPLWLGYVVVVNALVHRRTGTCMVTARPGLFLALFPVSAGFWWSFEYLNTFVGNWYYVGGGGDAWGYLLSATPPFATVLPAVLGTRDLLASWPRLAAGLDRVPAVAPAREPTAMAALLGGVLGLAALAVWPAQLFPLLWLAPPAIVIAVAALAGEPTVLSPLARGDARGLWQAALAALVCGFFWEMWNFGSLSRWAYSIPYVEGLRLFEMPVLGYSGYLPFGPACVAAAALVLGPRREILGTGQR